MEKNRIKQFIEDNKLDFTGSESNLNGQCVILAGYACYLGIENFIKLLNEFNEFDKDCIILPVTSTNELERVFNYAKNNNYGDWWAKPKAHKHFKF